MPPACTQKLVKPATTEQTPPLTEIAKNFHERNGAKLVQINETTQNFEYKII